VEVSGASILTVRNINRKRITATIRAIFFMIPSPQSHPGIYSWHY
jgi:hypothetical protein